MNETIIETRDLSLKFGRKTALERISVAFRPGEMVLIAGKNGAGKSTFLRCLARVLEPDKGKIIQAPELRRSDIGFISDSLSLFENLSLKAAIEFHCRVYHISDFDGRLLQTLKLGLERKIRQLSAGERVLFHLSLVLSQKPALILVDEVIHLLDPYVRELFLETLIEAIAEMRSALLMVNHTFSETERLPERVLLMDGGRFILDEKADSLRARVKKLSQEPAAGVPVLFSKETGPYREYYVYPFDEEFKKKYPAAYQDIGLPEIMKALIGGTYVEKRDQ